MHTQNQSKAPAHSSNHLAGKLLDLNDAIAAARAMGRPEESDLRRIAHIHATEGGVSHLVLQQICGGH